MPDCALEFAHVFAAGCEQRGSWHIYYRRYYVGTIQPVEKGWEVRHLDVDVGRFDSIEGAQRAVEEWYYGPITVEPTRKLPRQADTPEIGTKAL